MKVAPALAALVQDGESLPEQRLAEPASSIGAPDAEHVDVPARAVLDRALAHADVAGEGLTIPREEPELRFELARLQDAGTEVFVRLGPFAPVVGEGLDVGVVELLVIAPRADDADFHPGRRHRRRRRGREVDPHQLRAPDLAVPVGRGQLADARLVGDRPQVDGDAELGVGEPEKPLGAPFDLGDDGRADAPAMVGEGDDSDGEDARDGGSDSRLR